MNEWMTHDGNYAMFSNKNKMIHNFNAYQHIDNNLNGNVNNQSFSIVNES